MKKFIKTVLMLVGLLSFVSANEPAQLDSKTLEEVKKSNMLLSVNHISIQSGTDLGAVYYLKVLATSPQGDKELSHVFYDKTTKSIYIGQGFMVDGTPLSFKKDAKVVKEGVSFSYGKGKKELYVITDPQCPYCVKFQKAMEGKLDDYTVHVILFPLSFHKKAPVMIEWIMQGKDDSEKQKRFNAMLLNDSKDYLTLDKANFKYSPTVEEKMKKSTLAFSELEARGTPAVYDADFKPFNWSALIK
ncbi:MAG: thioredoxin fold domain-containing protein [Campylobacterales bacterium]|nr:thioredoxin fold domain-containing protein [Campylobacterales bacterium]